jgi:hypothetical protein
LAAGRRRQAAHSGGYYDVAVAAFGRGARKFADIVPMDHDVRVVQVMRHASWVS